MRILLITAFYPPYEIGGWEQLVADLNKCLRARGHETLVLTSYHGLAGPAVETGVARLLHLENDLQRYRPEAYLKHDRQLAQNLEQTTTVVDSFQPDIIFIHGMWNLTRGVPWIAEQMLPGRVVYYMASDWAYRPDIHTSYWNDAAARPLRGVLKRLAGIIPLRAAKREQRRFNLGFENVIAVSQAIAFDLARYAGIARERIHVIYNGVETDQFYPAAGSRWGERDGRGLSFIYAGALSPHKGVHTAIEAMSLLGDVEPHADAKLTIVGSGSQEYERQLREMVTSLGLGEKVWFRGRIPRDQMPETLREHDALLLPSLWEEPLSRVMQEAMASGLVVIGTDTGGTGELLVHCETGLMFEAGNSLALATQIGRLYNDRALGRMIADTARARVLAGFTLEKMVNEIEDYFYNIAHLKVSAESDSW